MHLIFVWWSIALLLLVEQFLFLIKFVNKFSNSGAIFLSHINSPSTNMIEKVSGVITYISLARKYKLSPVPRTQSCYTRLRVKALEKFLRNQAKIYCSSIFRKR